MGIELDLSPHCFGALRRIEDILDDGDALRERMERDGYLFLPGFLDVSRVMEIRRNILSQLWKEGALDTDCSMDEGVVVPGRKLSFRADLVQRDPLVRGLLFGPRITGLMRCFFGEDVLHFNYIWLRAMSRGHGTPPHCDIVYMGRGTRRLYTAWIPYGEVSLDLGGLMLLEKSHTQAQRIRKYLEMDVDTYCENRPAAQARHPNNWRFDGALSKNPRSLREKIGGRWLTTEYRPGDMVLFGMSMIHASLDNQTNRVRLSSDTRYQRASEPADHRWVGESPIGHGPEGKRGLIC